jgi:hypothetical protein
MSTPIALLVLAAFLGGAIWLGLRLADRFTKSRRGPLSPRAKRIRSIMVAFLFVYAMVVGWAFATGHAAIAIGVMVALVLLDPIVLIPLTIRRSRQRAREQKPDRAGG